MAGCKGSAGSTEIREHVKFYGTASSPSADEFRSEPSLTLCSPAVFARFAGRIASRSLMFMLAVGALDETIQAVRESPRVSIRISTYTLWLESEQVPSSRDDWHIDRIGAISGTGQTERYDATDYTKRRSFAVMSHFMTENARQDNRFYSDKISTEFVLQPSSVKLPDCRLATKEVQSDCRLYGTRIRLYTLRAGCRHCVQLTSNSPSGTRIRARMAIHDTCGGLSIQHCLLAIRRPYFHIRPILHARGSRSRSTHCRD